MTKTNLRPHLALPKASTQEERFQNDVLRPILKLQHSLLQLIFHSYIGKKKVQLYTFTGEEKRLYILKNIQKDTVLKQEIIGMVTGLMETEEFSYYLENRQVMAKRISQMAAERIYDIFS